MSNVSRDPAGAAACSGSSLHLDRARPARKLLWTGQARAQAGSRTNDEVNALETGNPHSVDFGSRAIPRRATNDEIDAGETGNPHSVDFASRVAPRRWATKDEINAAESGSPD